MYFHDSQRSLCEDFSRCKIINPRLYCMFLKRLFQSNLYQFDMKNNSVFYCIMQIEFSLLSFLNKTNAHSCTRIHMLTLRQTHTDVHAGAFRTRQINLQTDRQKVRGAISKRQPDRSLRIYEQKKPEKCHVSMIL